jgi:sulfatase modifying factor 1
MGAEKHAEALSFIDKALAAEPQNKEYLTTRELIKKSTKKK